MKYLLLLILISQSILADDVIQLSKGTSAPFDGFLFDREKALKVREQEIDLSLAKKTSDIFYEENIILKNQLKGANEHINNLSKQLVDARDSGFLTKAGFFLLGAAGATLMSYGVIHTLK